MNDDENKDLLSRVEEYGYYDEPKPYGLLNECAEEIKRLRAERDDARRMYCILRMRISNKPEATDTSQSLGWEGLWRGRSRHM